MKVNWYKYFLKYLRIYYITKKYFFIYLKRLLFIKGLSILLDICFGFFPNIFHDSFFWWIIDKIFLYIDENVFDTFGILEIVGCFLIFWFFFRVGNLDVLEQDRRLKQKELELKKKEEMGEDSLKIILTVQDLKVIRKQELKNYKNKLKKYL